MEKSCLPPPPPPQTKSRQTRGHTLGTTNVAGLHFRYISLVPVTTLYLRRRKQLLAKIKQTSEKKKTVENVVMINGRSNDGH